MNLRTDLAIEAHELADKAELSGVRAETHQAGAFSVTRVRVEEDGAAKLGKPKGEYVTVEAPHLLFDDPELPEALTRLVAEELSRMMGRCDGVTLVVGLGNRDITADALGPMTAERVLVTRHLQAEMPLFSHLNLSPVCAVIPGVLGLTGIETAEIVRGVAERVKPARILLIDALAARRMERVNTTVQLSDTGIQPGAGIGNHRLALDEETLGAPVFSLGVPTVVDAATIAADALSGLCRHAPDSFASFFAGMSESDRRGVLVEVLGGAEQNQIVTPKEMDGHVRRLAGILGEAVSVALQPRTDPQLIRDLIFT